MPEDLRGSSEPKMHKRVSFNEDVIAEHDLLRGTRMTIPDPDTPFLRGFDELSDDETQPSNMHKKTATPADLMAQAIAMHELQTEDERAKHDEFMQKRKTFYNEARVIRGLEEPPPDSSDIP